jgi:RimJ/RimL family protein N-acetyltransferase
VPVVLRPITPAAADALASERIPDDVRVAADYPTEFSFEVGTHDPGPLGPFFIHRAGDDVVIGEIGGSPTGGGVAMIGYALVPSCWGRGYATGAVRLLVERARELEEVERLTAYMPLERPASGRVLEKAGFTLVGEIDHEHDGVRMRVRHWELPV